MPDNDNNAELMSP